MYSGESDNKHIEGYVTTIITDISFVLGGETISNNIAFSPNGDGLMSF